jgi:hypothetical protein
LTQSHEEGEQRGVHGSGQPTRARWPAQTAVALVLALAAACSRDAGLESYERARAQADALVVAGRPATDPSYDEVLRLLESIPAGSRARARADGLRDRILAARRPAPRPLATGPTSAGDDPALAAKEAQCAALARALGLADAGQREEVAKRLAECRREADRYREARHHSAQP